MTDAKDAVKTLYEVIQREDWEHLSAAVTPLFLYLGKRDTALLAIDRVEHFLPRFESQYPENYWPSAYLNEFQAALDTGSQEAPWDRNDYVVEVQDTWAYPGMPNFHECIVELIYMMMASTIEEHIEYAWAAIANAVMADFVYDLGTHNMPLWEASFDDKSGEYAWMYYMNSAEADALDVELWLAFADKIREAVNFTEASSPHP
jgi:hypothetical protein